MLTQLYNIDHQRDYSCFCEPSVPSQANSAQVRVLEMSAGCTMIELVLEGPYSERGKRMFLRSYPTPSRYLCCFLRCCEAAVLARTRDGKSGTGILPIVGRGGTHLGSTGDMMKLATIKSDLASPLSLPPLSLQAYCGVIPEYSWDQETESHFSLQGGLASSEYLFPLVQSQVLPSLISHADTHLSRSGVILE